MGFQTRKAATRALLISVMLGGGLLYAGISQAQDAGVSSERGAELVAASGGPAPSAHLIAFQADKAAVDVRDDDVASVKSAMNATSPPPAVAAAQPQPVVMAQAGSSNR